MVSYATNSKSNDIILDFFAGSGTTAHAVLQQNKEDKGNRKFILVEQLEEHIKICKERIQKVLQKEDINDNFIYFELKQYNQKFIEQIQKSNTSEELIKIYEEIKQNAFVNYQFKEKEFQENIQKFRELSINEQKEILFKTIDTNQLYLNYGEM